MGLQKREIKVPSALTGLAEGLGRFLVDAYGEVKDKDGFSALDDLPGIGASFIENVLPNVQKMGEIKRELVEHGEASRVAIVLAVLDSLGVMLEEVKEAKKPAKKAAASAK